MTKGYGQYCSALNCHNCRGRNTDKSFFRFPTNPDISKQWVMNARRQDLLSKDANYLKKNCAICSDHFENRCFLNFLKNRLKPEAIPTIFKFPDSPTEEVISGRSRKSKRKLSNDSVDVMPTNTEIILPDLEIPTSLLLNNVAFEKEAVSSENELPSKKLVLGNIKQGPPSPEAIENETSEKHLTLENSTPKAEFSIKWTENEFSEEGVRLETDLLKNESVSSNTSENRLSCDSPSEGVTPEEARSKQVTENELSSECFTEATFKEENLLAEASENKFLDKEVQTRCSSLAQSPETIRKLHCLRVQVSYFKKRCKLKQAIPQKKRLTKEEVMEEAKQFLPNVAHSFFASQIQGFSKNTKGCRYNAETRKLLIGLHHESPKAYRYLQRYFTLPHSSTLFRWITSFKNNNPSALTNMLDSSEMPLTIDDLYSASMDTMLTDSSLDTSGNDNRYDSPSELVNDTLQIS